LVLGFLAIDLEFDRDFIAHERASLMV
jgi:hypothetical protein